MAGAGSRMTMKLLTSFAAIPIGIAVQRFVDQAWVAAHPEDPPKLVEDHSARWSDAVVWAALSAAGLAATEVFSRRAAETGFRTLFGTEPPPPKPTKSQKKAEKALAKDVGETARAAGDTTAAQPATKG